jgi:hypothetical protein
MQIFRKSLLLTAALALTAFAACSNDDNENGGDGKETDPDYLALPHAYGTYYHTYWGDAAGDYYLVLTDADLDQADAAPYKYRLDIDFLSVLATDPKSARPLDGEYTIGKSTDNKAGVFIEGFLGTDSFGMPALFGTYWNEPNEEEGSTTPHAIVGGKMRIKTDNGITTIKAEFIDEDDSTLRVSYRGALEFENRINDSYRGDSKLNADYAMNADAPVVSIKKITDECTARYDRWDLHFYEKECYATQGATGYLVQAENGSGAGIHSVGHLQSDLGRHARLPARHTGRARRRKSPGREHVVLQRPHAPCPDDQRFADPENVERNGLRSVVLDGRRPPDALSGDGIVLRNGEKARLQLGAPDRRIFAAVPLPGLPGRSGPESGRSQGRNFREVPALRFHAGRTVVGTAAAFGSGTVFRAAAALRTAPLSGQYFCRVWHRSRIGGPVSCGRSESMRSEAVTAPARTGRPRNQRTYFPTNSRTTAVYSSLLSR